MTNEVSSAKKDKEKKCWEYLIAHNQDLTNSPQDGLNDLGGEGWELMFVRSVDNVRIVEYIFKREVEQ